jgi:colicin import membrane protein
MALFGLGWIMSRVGMFSKVAVSIAVLTYFNVSVAAADSDRAAHAIAEKFASDGREARRGEVDRKAKEEADRQEAANRAAARLKAEEAEMLARARAEAAEREAAARAEAERRLAEEKAPLEQEIRDQDEERRALEAKRQAEALALSEKLRRARELREANRERSITPFAESDRLDRPNFLSGPPQTGEVDQENGAAAATAAPRAAVAGPHRALWLEQNVTILLIMEPGDRGIRRFDKSADTVLCLGAKCYAGMGSTAPAKLMTRAAALGPANTLGARAWGCRHSLTCIYRNVDLGAESGSIQPIDLKILRHDRREIHRVKADWSCEIDSAGSLHCLNLVRTRSWRAWIVPESVADRAGPAALEAALKYGLPDHRSAELH